MASKAVKEMEAWILQYLKENTEASAINDDFHERFWARFGGRRRETYWGAQPVAAAQRRLSEMYRRGLVDRRRCALGIAWQPGFPRWVLSYNLAPTARGEGRAGGEGKA